MNQLSEEQFIAEICTRLDRSIAALDSNVVVRLEVARESSLAAAHAITATDSAITQSTILNDEELADSVASVLKDNANVSPEVAQKLNQIRQQAIAQLDEKKSTATLLSDLADWINGFVHAIGNNLSTSAPMIATACLTLTVASVFYMSTLSDRNISVEDEILLVASADDLELYENLDFYLWLEEIEQTN